MRETRISSGINELDGLLFGGFLPRNTYLVLPPRAAPIFSTMTQAEFLDQYLCDYQEGFPHAKPVPAARIIETLSALRDGP